MTIREAQSLLEYIFSSASKLFCQKPRPVFGKPPNTIVILNQIFGKAHPKFLTEFYKFWSSSNIWKSLLTIDRAISEIRC